MAIYSAVPPPPELGGPPTNGQNGHQQNQQPPATPAAQTSVAIDIETWTLSALQSLSVSPVARGTGTPLAIPIDGSAAKKPSVTIQDPRAKSTAITPPPRPPSRRDSLRRREALLKGKEGSRQRRRWENDRLLHVPNAQPPEPMDYEPRPTHPVVHVPYQVAAAWDIRVRAEVEAKKAAAARRKQMQTRTMGDAHVAGRVPRELFQRAKKTPAVKTWVRSLEEPVRRYLVELEVSSEVSSEDTEDEEIVFVGRKGTTRDGWKKARREGKNEEGLVLDDLGDDDESGAFKRWITHSISDYYGLQSYSALVGNPKRKVVYVGVRSMRTGRAPAVRTPLRDRVTIRPTREVLIRLRIPSPQKLRSAAEPAAASNADYDLARPITSSPGAGLRQGLASYGDAHFSLFLRKAFIKALGYGEDALSRPVVSIANTASGLNPCHAGIAPQLLDAARRGVHLAGGLAVDFPTISLHESFASPTSMFLRNLMSMDTEEMIRAQPVDAVVLIGGCDKTTPAQLMGAISANKPAIHLVTGPMMPGSHRGVRIGACTDCRNNWAKYRAGTIDIEEISALNEELAPTAGTCGVMGTASTMACLLAALGMMPLKGATPPAVSAARLRVAEDTGACAVALARSQLRPQTVLTRESFLNAITVLQAIGGSTNAVVHLMAIANRHPALAGEITLQTVDEVGRRTPLLVDLKPSGDGYMTDFHNSGGVPALLHALRPLLHLDAMTVTGQTLGEALDTIPASQFQWQFASGGAGGCIRTLADPLYPASSLVVLRGNLAPGGAVTKSSASKDRRLLRHRGPAVVFAGVADLAARVDDPDLDVSADSVLVLQGIGPLGRDSPGMPEAGLIPIPRKLAARGVTDMLRISDGRMSGTAGGTIVLHVSPEAADPQSAFGILRDGDVVAVDAEERVLRVELSDEEIGRRMAERRERVGKGEAEGAGAGPWVARHTMRGYRGLYMRSVNHAELGADFDFLTARGPASS
ncbi:hypothetical protein DL764_005831 [Monosporascus ibericus]|uniref:Uncharacterized protein n=1 Tax=Monosporascus ibericus TaxID=155417 RepID=A0A4V1XAD3_9PEZI|nr:hypothetical protein DL764_005831 [Monosporascus ibericus]